MASSAGYREQARHWGIDNHYHLHLNILIRRTCGAITMYVCVCKAVSDKKVRRAIDNGACSVRALRDELGVGSVCGRCVPDARAMIDASAARTQPMTLAMLVGSESLTGAAA